MKLNFVTQILESIVHELDAKLVLEPHFRFGGYIEFNNGVRTYYVESAFDINGMGAARLARDKGYTNHFLQSFGFSIPEYQTFPNHVLDKYITSEKSGFDRGREYCVRLGFPIIIKPNDGTKGSDVYKLNSIEEYNHIGKLVFDKNRVVMLQRFVTGNDYRIVVFNNKVVCAYQRIGLQLVGDGESTIWQLLNAKKLIEKLNLEDPRITTKLESYNLTMDSILEKDISIRLLDVNNLSLGGTAIDKSQVISKYFRDIAIQATHQMGLDFCGVDIMTQAIEESDCDYNIIEINSSPGQGNFARLGKEQEQIVKDLYKEILLTIKERKSYSR